MGRPKGRPVSFGISIWRGSCLIPAMPSLTIRHVTTYRYRQPVAFGEHRMMLRPRDSHDQKVIDATLGITPQPSSLRFDRDAFGNHVAIAEFAATATELASRASSASSIAPVGSCPGRGLAGVSGRLRRRREPDLDDCLPAASCRPARSARWARQFLDAGAPIGALDLLTRLSQGIHRGVRLSPARSQGHPIARRNVEPRPGELP